MTGRSQILLWQLGGGGVNTTENKTKVASLVQDVEEGKDEEADRAEQQTIWD
jgi:hypothetical protein